MLLNLDALETRPERASRSKNAHSGSRGALGSPRGIRAAAREMPDEERRHEVELQREHARPKYTGDWSDIIAALKNGRFPPEFIDAFRLVNPETELGREFQRLCTEHLRAVCPQSFWDLSQKPVQFLLADLPEANAFVITGTRVVVLTTGLFRPQNVDADLYNQRQQPRLLGVHLPSNGREPPVGSATDLRTVLLHELCHIKKADLFGDGTPNSKFEESFAYVQPFQLLHQAGENPYRAYYVLLKILQHATDFDHYLAGLVDPHPSKSHVARMSADTLAGSRFTRGDLLLGTEVVPFTPRDPLLAVVKQAHKPEGKAGADDFQSCASARVRDLYTMTPPTKAFGALCRLLTEHEAALDSGQDKSRLLSTTEIFLLGKFIRGYQGEIPPVAVENILQTIFSLSDNNISVYLYRSLGIRTNQLSSKCAVGHVKDIEHRAHDLLDYVRKNKSSSATSTAQIVKRCQKLLSLINSSCLHKHSPMVDEAHYNRKITLRSIDLIAHKFPSPEEMLEELAPLLEAAKTNAIACEAVVALGLEAAPGIAEAWNKHFNQRGNDSQGVHYLGLRCVLKRMISVFDSQTGRATTAADFFQISDMNSWSDSPFNRRMHDTYDEAKRILQPVLEQALEIARSGSNLQIAAFKEHLEGSIYLIFRSNSAYADAAITNIRSWITPQNLATVRQKPEIIIDMMLALGFLESEDGRALFKRVLRDLADTPAHRQQIAQSLVLRACGTLRDTFSFTISNIAGEDPDLLIYFAQGADGILSQQDVGALFSRLLPLKYLLKADSPLFSNDEACQIFFDDFDTKEKILLSKSTALQSLSTESDWSKIVGVTDQITGAVTDFDQLCFYLLLNRKLAQQEFPSPEQLLRLDRLFDLDGFLTLPYARLHRQEIALYYAPHYSQMCQSAALGDAVAQGGVLRATNLILQVGEEKGLLAIIRRLGDAPAEERIKLSSSVLSATTIQSSALREALYAHMSSASLEMFGLDNNTPAYRQRVVSELAPRLQSMSAPIRAECLKRIAEDAQLQFATLGQFDEALKGDVSISPLTLGLLGTLTEALLDISEQDPNGTVNIRVELLSFLNEPYSDRNAVNLISHLTRLKEMLYGPGQSHARTKLLNLIPELDQMFFGPRETQTFYNKARRAGILTSFRNSHSEYSRLPTEAKAVIVRTVIMPSDTFGEVSERVLLYAISCAFDARDPYFPQINKAIRAGIMALHPDQRGILLAGLTLSAGERASNARSLCRTGEVLGPGWIKAMQAAAGDERVEESYRIECERVKFDADRPARKEVVHMPEMVRTQLESDYRLHLAQRGEAYEGVVIQRVGRCVGSGSMGVVIALEMSNGREIFAYFLRPFVDNRASDNFRVMSDVAKALADDGFADLFGELIAHGSRTKAMECDVMLAPTQHARARELIGDRVVTIDGTKVRVDVADAFCPACVEAADLLTYRYFLMDPIPGEVLTNLIGAAAKKAAAIEGTAMNPELLNAIMGNLTCIISAQMQGHKICFDRHDGNSAVAPGPRFGHFDMKLQPLDDPSEAGLKQFGALLADLIIRATSRPEGALIERFQEFKHGLPKADPYLEDLQRTYSALRTQFAVLNPQQLFRVILSATVDASRKGMSPAVREEFMRAFAAKAPAPVVGLFEALVKRGEIPTIPAWLWAFVPPELTPIIDQLGIKEIGRPGYVMTVEHSR